MTIYIHCREGKRYTPSFIPVKEEEVDAQVSGIEKFEAVEVDESNSMATEIQYGLTKRDHHRRGDHMSQADREAEALKSDLHHLPPEASIEDYDKMPVEDFGKALMRGMGWYEGRGIGRNAKGEVDAKELVRRSDRLGLGADPAASVKKEKKYIKPGESRHQGDMVYVDDSGATKSSRPVHASLTDRRTLGVVAGKKMYVQRGRHSGFECEVKSVGDTREDGSEKAVVRLLPSMETVHVRCKDLIEIGQKKTSEDRHKQHRKDDDGKFREVKRAKTKHDEPQAQRETTPWLLPGIRVKVVDKNAFKGRVYLKKGTIIDVVSPTVCDIYIDDFKEIFQHISQKQLETSVPRQKGAPIMVVAGKYKQRLGQLLHRSKHSEYVAVQVHDEDDVQKLHLDDVAEYRGHE